MRIFIAIFFLAFIVACSNQNLDQKDRMFFKNLNEPNQSNVIYDFSDYKKYIDWFKKYPNFLSEEVKVDSMVFGALYQPVDWIVFKDSVYTNFKDYVNSRNQYAGMEYFIFCFGDIVGNDVLKSSALKNLNRNKLMQYMDFTIQNDFQIEDCYGKRQCVFFHLEQSSNLRPYYSAMIGFERKSEQDTCDKTLIYNDKIFDKGIVKITIPGSKLKLVPKLKTPTNFTENENI